MIKMNLTSNSFKSIRYPHTHVKLYVAQAFFQYACCFWIWKSRRCFMIMIDTSFGRGDILRSDEHYLDDLYKRKRTEFMLIHMHAIDITQESQEPVTLTQTKNHQFQVTHPFSVPDSNSSSTKTLWSSGTYYPHNTISVISTPRSSKTWQCSNGTHRGIQTYQDNPQQVWRWWL